jgi:hypothetical protein
MSFSILVGAAGALVLLCLIAVVVYLFSDRGGGRPRD